MNSCGFLLLSLRFHRNQDFWVNGVLFSFRRSFVSSEFLVIASSRSRKSRSIATLIGSLPPPSLSHARENILVTSARRRSCFLMSFRNTIRNGKASVRRARASLSNRNQNQYQRQSCKSRIIIGARCSSGARTRLFGEGTSSLNRRRDPRRAVVPS